MDKNFKKLLETLQKIADDTSVLEGGMLSVDVPGGRVFMNNTEMGDWVCLIEEGPNEDDWVDGRGDCPDEAAAMALWNWLRKQTARKDEGGNTVFLNFIDGTVWSSKREE